MVLITCCTNEIENVYYGIAIMISTLNNYTRTSFIKNTANVRNEMVINAPSDDGKSMLSCQSLASWIPRLVRTDGVGQSWLIRDSETLLLVIVFLWEISLTYIPHQIIAKRLQHFYLVLNAARRVSDKRILDLTKELHYTGKSKKRWGRRCLLHNW